MINHLRNLSVPAPECKDMWDEKGTTPCMAICPIDEGGAWAGDWKTDASRNGVMT